MSGFSYNDMNWVTRIYLERMRMMSWIRKYQGVLIIVAIIIMFIGYKTYLYFFVSQKGQIEATAYDAEEWQKNDGEVEGEKKKTNELVIVDVKGAVKRPGVYEAFQGDRVVDLLKKAGGINEQGEESGINLALKVTDEMVIYVPYKGEEKTKTSAQSLVEGGSVGNGGSNGGVIDLNKATAAELDELPGIGPTRAETIIEYRDSNGGFSSKEDLKNISGIGEKTYEKLADLVTVN